jgi:NTE family protein
MAVGLVLGGGGVAGQAYHAGVLAALEQDLGWDARTADVIVGTSAGAITGTLLRAGVPPTDLAAWTVRAPLSDEGAMLEHLFGTELPELAPMRVANFVRPPRLPGAPLVRRLLSEPYQLDAASVLFTLVAAGRADVLEYLSPLREVQPSGWPERDLWICAVRRSDARLTVFGAAGSPEAPLHLAVAASCAVPAYFTPVRIAGVSYLDGGVHSATNAAVLRRRHLDLVVVVSPMSGQRGVPTGMADLIRRHAGQRLRREVDAIRAAGAEVVVYEPDRAVRDAMGGDMLPRRHVEDIVREAFLSAGRHTAGPEVRTDLRRLDARARRRAA